MAFPGAYSTLTAKGLKPAFFTMSERDALLKQMKRRPKDKDKKRGDTRGRSRSKKRW